MSGQGRGEAPQFGIDPVPNKPALSNESDAALIERIRAGDADAFAELVRRYQPSLLRVARSRLGRDDWAEEVVQETFLAVFKSCHSFNPRYGFRAWLWTILMNRCHGHYRQRSRVPPTERLPSDTADREDLGVPEDSNATPLGRLLAKERAALLESLLEQLTAVQADALRLRFFGGLKFHEIADAMGCSLLTAKNRVRAGLLRLATLAERTDDLRAAKPSDFRDRGERGV